MPSANILRKLSLLFSALFAENKANNLRKTCLIKRKNVSLQPKEPLIKRKERYDKIHLATEVMATHDMEE